MYVVHGDDGPGVARGVEVLSAFLLQGQKKLSQQGTLIRPFAAVGSQLHSAPIPRLVICSFAAAGSRLHSLLILPLVVCSFARAGSQLHSLLIL